MNHSYQIDKLPRDDKIKILSEIGTDDQIDNILLSYEMDNYEPQEIISEPDSEKIHDLINTLSSRYQYKVGGYCLEDIYWRDSSEMIDKIIKNDKQIVFINSVWIEHFNDYELNNYLKKFVKLINKHFDTTKMLVEYKLFEDDKHDLAWVFLIIN